MSIVQRDERRTTSGRNNDIDFDFLFEWKLLSVYLNFQLEGINGIRTRSVNAIFKDIMDEALYHTDL